MSASEKIAKLEGQLKRGLITRRDFMEEGKRVLEEAGIQVKEGEVWYATSKNGERHAFLARFISYRNAVSLYRLTESPSHSPLEYWRDERGYTGFTRILGSA